MEQSFGHDADLFICIVQGSNEFLMSLEIPFVLPLKVTCEQEEGISNWFRFVLLRFGFPN
jgi:hypothetical protein